MNTSGRVLRCWKGVYFATVLSCGSIDNRAPRAAEITNGDLGGDDAGSESPFTPERQADAGPLHEEGDTGPSPDEEGTGGQFEPTHLSGGLGSNRESFDFARAEVGGTPLEFRWQIANVGSSPTGPLLIRRDGSLPFETVSTCEAGLAPGAFCAVTVFFTPTVARFFSDTLRLTDGNEQITLPVSGTGQFRLTVDRVGAGAVTSEDGELTCAGNTCTGLYDPGTVTLRARTENGSSLLFTGWYSAEEDCGPSHTCSVSLEQSRRVGAEFQPLQHNLVFVSSQPYPANLGGVAAYDAECNRLASAAGINNSAGNAFISALSTPAASMRQRLSGARGWVRRDGRVFADTIDDLFASRVRHSFDFDETGARLDPRTLSSTQPWIWTGTSGTGEIGSTCNGWSSALDTDTGIIGRSTGGAAAWLSRFTIPCSDTTMRIACMATTRSTPATLPVVTGKRIWITTPYATGVSQTPDQKCQAERPSGVGSGVAFIGYSNRPAADVLDETANYVRPDGVLVGTGAQLADMHVFAGPWIQADGSALEGQALVRTGGETPRTVPTRHCNDWQSADAALSGGVGDFAASDIRFFDTLQIRTCDVAVPILCVEP